MPPSPEALLESQNMQNDHLLDALGDLVGSQLSPILRSLNLLNHLFGTRFGIGPTVLLGVLSFTWAFSRMAEQLYTSLATFVTSYFMSFVSFDSSDEIYMHMMKWLATQPLVASSRNLTAETVAQTSWEEEEGLEALQSGNIAGDAKYFNFSNQRAKVPPRFTPSLGIHGFWHGTQYFRLDRKQQIVNNSRGRVEKEEKVTVSCFGRNTKAIKELLRTAKDHYYGNHTDKTTIYRPIPCSSQRSANALNWYIIAKRPVRSMSTVVLDAKLKNDVLADINEYLHPRTPRWYANLGIPLRRGYLVHGPTGTGKTSFCFALAGVFGLDIYVVSLKQNDQTDENLSTLFSVLPWRCIVLLEDIDAAGLNRPAEEAEDEGQDKKDVSAATIDALKADQGGEGVIGGQALTTEEEKQSDVGPNNKDDWKVADLARALKHGGGRAADEKKGITLSGLLNAIDGVASQEGRVLIMTTNHPELLDEALIRPGRVDLQVAFTNASAAQAKELFERIYKEDRAVPGSAKDGLLKRDPNEITEGSLKAGSEQLQGMVQEFGEKIPDGVLSPAEIQGFLIRRKGDPTRAVEETDRWVEAMKAQKKSKTKVMSVQ